MDRSRREFIRRVAAAGAGVGITSRGAWAASRPADGEWPVCMFEKNFQLQSYDEIGRNVAAAGLQGIEATVRPKGHIEPERAAEELPAAVEALKRHGMEIIVMASGVNAVNPLNESVLRTAAKLGIKRYRMAYWRYQDGVAVRKQLGEFKKIAADVAAMNEEIGIQGIYQNHAGAHVVSGPMWDLVEVLEGIDPAQIGIGLDVRHCRVENGASWPLTFDLARPQVEMIYVKDAVWDGPKVKNVPLGEGLVTEKVVKHAFKGLKPVPVALHVEYFGGKPLPPEKLPEVYEAHRRDFALLRKWMG